MKKKYKSIFISDVHLFSKHCKADILTKFLKEYKSENLFLLGDILDLIRLKRKFHCTKNQMNVIHQLLKLARHETKIVYILGNHDFEINSFLEYDITIENIKLCTEYEYTTHNKKFILMHGDAFDLPIVRSLYVLGDYGYNLILEINHWFNKIRNILHLPYWSISQRIKHSVKNAVKFIEDYEKSLLKFCIHKNYDGIISGHIHKAKLERIDYKYIFNTGDWQESCTAIIEDFDGNFTLIEYINDEFEEIKRIGVS